MNFDYYTHVKQQLATQDYIKTLASLCIKDGRDIVKLKDVSSKLKVSNAAVSDMVKKLMKDGLVFNHPYKGIELTDCGWQMGRRLIRHHRLWEVFLHQALSVPWDEVHKEAEHLEHAASDALMDRIDEYLGFPKVDPHGNPIPTASGELTFNDAEIPLVEGVKGEVYYVTRFESMDSSYLNYLSQNGFAIGVSIKVLERFEFDQSLLGDMNGHHLQFSPAVAKQIFVTNQCE